MFGAFWDRMRERLAELLFGSEPDLPRGPRRDKKAKRRVFRQFGIENLEPRQMLTAVNLYFDPGHDGPGNGTAYVSGGAGTWDTTSASWYNPSSDTDQPWCAGANAFFTGVQTGGATVSVGADVTANSIEFLDSAFYTIDGSSHSITMTGDHAVYNVSGYVNTISSGLAGTSGLVVSGSGVVTLAGTNTYTGGTTVTDYAYLDIAGASTPLGSTSDPLTLTDHANLWVSGNDLTVGGLIGDSTTTVGTYSTGSSQITLDICVPSGTTDTFSGVIQDTGFAWSGGGYSFGTAPLGVLFEGTGTQVVTGDNTYTGGTTILTGAQLSGGFHGTGDGGVDFTGSGTLQFLADGTLSPATPITIASGQIATLDMKGHTVTYPGAIDGAGNLEIEDTVGGGALTLSGNNSFTGTTTIDSGMLVLSGNNTTTGSIDIESGATLQLGDPNGLGNTSGITGDGILDLNHQTFGIPADISGFGSGTIEHPKNPLTPAGTVADTPAVQDAAQNSPAIAGSGVRYFDGTVDISSTPLVPDTVTQFWSQELIWTNNPLLLTGSNGDGMTSADQPQLVQTGKGTFVVTDGSNSVWFDLDSGMSYTNTYDLQFVASAQDTLVYAPTGHAGQFELTDTNGNAEYFYDFSSTWAAQRGQLASFVNGAGEGLNYTYVPSGVNAGRVASVTLVNGSTTIRNVQYAYYGTGDSFGNPGDLQTATIYYGTTITGTSNVIDRTYYRWYTSADAGSVGYAGGLQYVFSTEAYQLLTVAHGTTLSSITNTQAAPFADLALQYDSQKRVTQIIVQGAGTTENGGDGRGTYTYQYDANSYSGTDFNTWKYKTIEDLPDGTANIVYANYVGETMLTVHAASETAAAAGSGDPQWITFYAYDGTTGELIMQADPSAVTGYSESDTDLLGGTGGGEYDYLSDTTGLIHLTDYYGTTTATDSESTSTNSDDIGGVQGYVMDYAVENGDTGTHVLLESFQYYLDTPVSGGVTVAPVATDTVYVSTDGSVASDGTLSALPSKRQPTPTPSLTAPIKSSAWTSPRRGFTTRELDHRRRSPIQPRQFSMPTRDLYGRVIARVTFPILPTIWPPMR